MANWIKFSHTRRRVTLRDWRLTPLSFSLFAGIFGISSLFDLRLSHARNDTLAQSARASDFVDPEAHPFSLEKF